MAEMNELVLNIITNAETASRKLKNFNKTLDDANDKTKKVTKNTNLLSRSFRNLFGAWLGFQGIKSMVSTARELDLMQRSIEGLTKSTQDWQYIQQQAFRTGTQIKDVAKGYRNFYAAASMAGFGKGNIQNMYADLLTSTRSIGANPIQTQGALLALEQMISKGRVSMEELRRQLGNALPGAFEIGAKAMGMSTQKFNQAIKDGISSVEFVPKFIEQLKKEYAPGFNKSIQSMDFALNNLSTAWMLLQHEFMSGEMGKGFVEFIKSITQILQSNSLKSTLKFIGQILGFIAKVLAVVLKQSTLLVTLLAPAVIMGIVNGFKALATAIAGVNLSMFPMYATILGIIAALAVLQDLLYGIVGYFKPNLGLSSITGEFLNEITGRPVNQGETTADYQGRMYMQRPLGNKTVGESMKTMERLKTRPMEMYSSPNNNLSLNKTSSNSIGDINININGSDSPQNVALAVRDELVALFNGVNTINGGEAMA